MTERKKIIGGFVAFLVLVAVLGFISVLIDRRGENEPENPTVDGTVQVDENGQPVNITQPFVQPEVPAVPTSPELYVRQLSRIFVERFGSYSNQNNNQHIEDIQPLLSPTMRTWVDSQRQQQSTEYQGQTTSLVSSSLTSFSPENSATVKIGVQQEQTVGNITEMVYRDGRVELVYQNGEWLIDGLYFD